MMRYVPLMMMLGASLALTACGGGGKSGKSGKAEVSAFEQLQAIPADVDAQVAEVTKPVDGVDLMLDQMKVMPNKLKISDEEFGAVLTQSLRGEELTIPDSVQGKSREEFTAFATKFAGFSSDLVATPARAQDLVTELATTTTRIPALATQASTQAATVLANPLSSKEEKAKAKQQQKDVKTIQKDAQDRVKAASDKVGELPNRSAVALNKFIAAAKDMKIDEAALRAAKKPVDDAKDAAKTTVDTAVEGVENAAGQ